MKMVDVRPQRCDTCKLEGGTCELMATFKPGDRPFIEQVIVFSGCYHWQYTGDIGTDMQDLIKKLADLPLEDAVRIIAESRFK